MNIDELALKVAKEVYGTDTSRWAEREEVTFIKDFASALIAEYEADQGEAVAWVYTVNNTYEVYSKGKPPEDAYDKGSLFSVFLRPDPKVKELEAEVARLKLQQVEVRKDLDLAGDVVKKTLRIAELERQLREALAMDNPADLLVARDKLRDAALLREMSHFRVFNVRSSGQDIHIGKAIRKYAVDRESGEWVPGPTTTKEKAEYAQVEKGLREERDVAQKLREQLSEARKDTDRLDYIQQNGSTVEVVGTKLFFQVGGRYRTQMASIREAIDAAMKGGE